MGITQINHEESIMSDNKTLSANDQKASNLPKPKRDENGRPINPMNQPAPLNGDDRVLQQIYDRS